MTSAGTTVTGPQRGFALLVVLWTVGFLALLGTRLVAAGRSDIALADNLKQEAVLAAAADGALSEVMFRMIAARDPGYRADGAVHILRVGPTTVRVRINHESDRINLNTAPAVLLRALVIACGEAPAAADRVAAAILDWRTSGASPRSGGAKAAEYRAAGRDYGPPGAPFEWIGELADVLGVTPELFACVAPHLTVLTDGDPDMSTRDPMVARALTDAAGVAEIAQAAGAMPDQIFRISVTAAGSGNTRYSIVAVASGEFEKAGLLVNILLREHGKSVTTGADIVTGSK